jgi:hypothetical protein
MTPQSVTVLPVAVTALMLSRTLLSQRMRPLSLSWAITSPCLRRHSASMIPFITSKFHTSSAPGMLIHPSQWAITRWSLTPMEIAHQTHCQTLEPWLQALNIQRLLRMERRPTPVDITLNCSMMERIHGASSNSILMGLMEWLEWLLLLDLLLFLFSSNEKRL